MRIEEEVFSACPEDEVVAKRAVGYANNQPLDGYKGEMSLADAYCAQSKYVAGIAETYGGVMGYKVGFTNLQWVARWTGQHVHTYYD